MTESNETSPRSAAVGLLADPGLPAVLADLLHDTLSDRLRAEASDAVKWTVDTVHEPFEAMYPDDDQLMGKARQHVRDTVWDLVVCITDQPMWDESGVVVASLHTDERVAVVSLPALGAWDLRRRLGDLVVRIIAYLTGLSSRLPGDVVHESPYVDIVRPRRWAVARLLTGMVRMNRPWQLFCGLSRALAGALTGMTFGVLYSTIWTLGASLGPWRLAALTTVAVGALTVWIVAGHDLWERRPHVRLRNASTVVTILVGTVAFFLAMFLIALAAVALVIPPDYLSNTLGHAADVSDYVIVALMASVLGTIAGAVGSGLEDDVTVREATYGYREQQRRRRVEREAEDGTTPTRRYRRS
ncbi:hypothetical protein GC106_43280 [Kibdelosporangium sp. 4NS15]|uniref:Uncharacterized protein n=1 Tax=Kibdelosporangium persicum TaxID=2698649 RepID=A0ABX2F8G2_9PSEU|nr:hypothetical protein [Kibdelosporangium persicum]NRN67095.1 hypothetical protein [Kibdelosporangium persicum]